MGERCMVWGSAWAGEAKEQVRRRRSRHGAAAAFKGTDCIQWELAYQMRLVQASLGGFKRSPGRRASGSAGRSGGQGPPGLRSAAPNQAAGKGTAPGGRGEDRLRVGAAVLDDHSGRSRPRSLQAHLAFTTLLCRRGRRGQLQACHS